MKESSSLNSRKICDEVHFQAIQSESSDAFSDQLPTLARAPPGQPLSEQNNPPTEMQFGNEEDAEALGVAALPLLRIEDPKPHSAGAAPTASKTDSPRRKGVKAGASSSCCADLVPCKLQSTLGWNLNPVPFILSPFAEHIS